MSTGAIIMMVVGCTGLWGGCVIAIALAIRHEKKNQ